MGKKGKDFIPFGSKLGAGVGMLVGLKIGVGFELGSPVSDASDG